MPGIPACGCCGRSRHGKHEFFPVFGQSASRLRRTRENVVPGERVTTAVGRPTVRSSSVFLPRVLAAINLLYACFFLLETPSVLPSCTPTFFRGRAWQLVRRFLTTNHWDADFKLNGFQRDCYAFAALATSVHYEVFESGVCPFYGIRLRPPEIIPDERE